MTPPNTQLQLHGASMGTCWSATVLPPAEVSRAALHKALEAAVHTVDAQMSPWRPDSVLNQLNRAPTGVWIALPAPIFEVLQMALQVCHASAGAFDPNVGALVNAWGFGPERAQPALPAIRRASQAPPRPTTELLELDASGRRARKHAALHLDLCGIAKGYAVDAMAAVLQAHGVTQALLAIDGELRALGCQADGSAWPIALEAPRPNERAVHGVLLLQEVAVATSGDYRHFFDLGAERISHTMDARQRRPLRNAVASVTVLAPSCMAADAWATALLVAGAQAGLALAQRQQLSALWLLRHEQGLLEVGSGCFAAGDASAQPRQRSTWAKTAHP